MKLLNEDLLFERLSGKLFVNFILELLSKNDIIGTARGRIIDRDGEFIKAKEDDYVKEFPVADIKQDIQEFVDEWVKSIQSKPEVLSVSAEASPYLGFSEYIEIRFKVPNNKKLQPYYRQNKGRYKNCYFQFTDHAFQKAPYKNKAGKIIRDQVEYQNKSFSQASTEMEAKIDKYINKIHKWEKDYLKSLIINVSDINTQIYGSNNHKLVSKFESVINKQPKTTKWWLDDKTLEKVVKNLLDKDIQVSKDCLREYMENINSENKK